MAIVGQAAQGREEQAAAGAGATEQAEAVDFAHAAPSARTDAQVRTAQDAASLEAEVGRTGATEARAQGGVIEEEAD